MGFSSEALHFLRLPRKEITPYVVANLKQLIAGISRIQYRGHFGCDDFQLLQRSTAVVEKLRCREMLRKPVRHLRSHKDKPFTIVCDAC